MTLDMELMKRDNITPRALRLFMIIGESGKNPLKMGFNDFIKYDGVGAKTASRLCELNSLRFDEVRAA